MRLSGTLTSAALLSTFRDMESDARVTAAFCALIDLRDIRSADGLHSEEARAIATGALDTVPRCAFVAQHPAVFGFCRVFSVCRELVDGEPVGVFRSVRDAEEWLGLPADTDDA